jgi:hypothetical protein
MTIKTKGIIEGNKKKSPARHAHRRLITGLILWIIYPGFF